MANPVLVQDEFIRMVRDRSRDQLGKNECHNLVDYLPNLGAPLRKRGGWEYFGVALDSLEANTGVPKRVAYAPFSAGGQVVAYGVDSDVAENVVFDLTNGVERGNVGFSFGGEWVFFDNLLIMPLKGASDPLKYGGSSNVASLGGSPPNFSTAAVYRNRLVGANDTTTKNRIWFSGAGDAESWDTTSRWIDTSDDVIGLAPLRNALLVFHPGSVERIRGDIPPGSAAANMELGPLFSEVGIYGGSTLARDASLCVSDEYVYFADEAGIYQSDGTSLADLTALGGIQHYYRSQVGVVGASGTIALGVWRGYLFVSMLESDTDYVDFLVCEIRSRSWFRMANIRALNFAARQGAIDELYFSNQDTSSKKVGKLSGLFSPASGVKNDANGTAVTPVLETRMYDIGTKGKERIRDLYLSYDLRDAGSDNPTLAASIVTSPEATSYTALSSVSESSALSRSRIPVGKRCNQIGFKVAQANASADTRLYSLELFGHNQEGSKR